MKHTKRFGSVIMLSSLISLEAFAASNISTTDKSAWSENSGWLNFKDANGGVTVYSDHLEGYVWAENIGWIRLGTHTTGGTHTYVNDSATNYGVNNNSGSLEGYAWSENAGWIQFDDSNGGVTINATTGDFDGYAWAENVGWIHFKNASPAAYKVSYDVPITVDLSVSASTGTEADATAITVTATASAAVTGDQTVNLAVTGVDSSDYTLSDTTLTISDGQTTGTVTFTLVDDSANEGTETATLTISSPSAGIALGSTTSQTVSITDNDAPPTPPPAAPAPTPAPTTPSTSSSSSSSSSSTVITTTPTGGAIVQFEGEGSGSVTASENSSGEFSCHSSETCPTQIQIGWYRFEATADQGSQFVEWRGQNCEKGEYTTSFGGTCIAEFKKLPPPVEEPVKITPSPVTPTVPDITPSPVTPTVPKVTEPTPVITEPTTPTPPVVTEPVKPVSVNKVGFSTQAYQASENAEKVDIIVNRQGTTGEVSVDLLSSDDSGKASIHYRPIVKTLFWAKGDDTEITVPVEIIDNLEVDGNKAVILSLGNVDNAEIHLDTAVLTIEDDDTPQVVEAKPEPNVPTPPVPVRPEEPTQVEIAPIEDAALVERDEFALPTNTVVGSGPVNPCNTSDELIGVCHAHAQSITYQAIGVDDSLSNGILDHPLTSKGLVSNTTITEKGHLKGGQVSGYTQNEGLIENVEFVGASISGKNEDGEITGTLGGQIKLASLVGGVVSDVRLAPETQIVGTGKPKVGAHQNRDQLGGSLIGDSKNPAILKTVHIRDKSQVANVIIDQDVTIGENITFTNIEFRTEVVRQVTLSGQITGTRFQNTYTRLENVTISANSHLSNLVIGNNVRFEEGVTLDDSVTFEVHQQHKATKGIETLPKLKGLAALDKQGSRVSTWARLEGGARMGSDGSHVERYQKKLTFKTKQPVEILGNVLTDVRHIGKRADIVVVAAHTPPGATSPNFYMLDNKRTPKPWDGTLSSLVAFQSITALAPVISVPIWNNPLDIKGGVQVYLGYRLNEGLIIYSEEDVIEITLTE